jgi:hypothetical protein
VRNYWGILLRIFILFKPLAILQRMSCKGERVNCRCGHWHWSSCLFNTCHLGDTQHDNMLILTFKTIFKIWSMHTFVWYVGKMWNFQ